MRSPRPVSGQPFLHVRQSQIITSMGQFKAFQGWDVYRKLPRKVLKVLDGHALAIARLKIHGIMTEAEGLKAWERLIQKTKKEIQIHNKP